MGTDHSLSQHLALHQNGSMEGIEIFIVALRLFSFVESYRKIIQVKILRKHETIVRKKFISTLLVTTSNVVFWILRPYCNEPADIT